ncbi:Hypothetical_protein [Hexamita inflata]|uniref:Hypothetical_protein n=1 Tax=Hexamita inflata TaxID=28002 RepID=A0AA86NJS1_9EUKA|nr:Hypothetical protein HINF_LOCUS8967 [Hexamita inflata]
MNQDEIIQQIIKKQYELAQKQITKSNKNNISLSDITKDVQINQTPEISRSKQQARLSKKLDQNIQEQSDISSDYELVKPDIKKLRAKAKKICKRLAEEPSEVLLDIEFSSSYSENTKNKISELKSKIKRKSPAELTDYYTQLFKEALQFYTDVQQATPKQICKIIDNLTPGSAECKCFWNGLSNNNFPKKNPCEYKSYYQRSYKRAAYSDKLNNDDKQQLRTLYEKNIFANISKLTQEAIDTFLSGRDIFPEEIHKFISKYSYNVRKEEFPYYPKKEEKSTKIFFMQMKATENEEDYHHNLYNRGLRAIQYLNIIESKSQLCLAVHYLKGEQNEAFWNYVVQNDERKLGISQLQSFYKEQYEKHCAEYIKRKKVMTSGIQHKNGQQMQD